MAKTMTALMLLLAFAWGPATLAQDQAGASSPPIKDWQGLHSLKPGKEIVVYTRQGKVFEGRFVDLQGSTLGLAMGLNIFDFEQAEIDAVHQKPGSRKKGRIIGAIIGTLAGAIIAAAISAKVEANQTAPQESAGFGLGTGMLGGGALGAHLGRRLDHKRKGKLLYKSK